MNRQLHVSALVACALVAGMSTAAPDCVVPANGNWSVNQDCDVTQNSVALGDVTVDNDATVTVKSGRHLSVDLANQKLLVRDGSRVIVENGGRLFSHPVHYQMSSNTDGTFGYYLKRVGGPEVDVFQEDFVFYPSSTVKVLEALHAFRALQAANDPTLLDTTIINVCPSGATNCTDNQNSMNNCTSGSFCNAANPGQAPLPISLRTAILRMMIPSDNEATNLLQEFYGNGTPSVGRAAMTQTAQAVAGTSANTQLNHKFACCNTGNNPANQLTLTDAGILYEQLTNNNAVLQPSFRNLMLAHAQNEIGGMTCGDANNNGTDDCVNQASFYNNQIAPTVQQEALKAGLSTSDAASFAGLVRVAMKDGNIGSREVSIAGWIELPINGGAGTREYVYGLFIAGATVNNTPSLRVLAANLLRNAMFNAAVDF